MTVSLDDWPKRQPPAITLERDGDNVHATVTTTRQRTGKTYTDHVDLFAGSWYCTCGGRGGRCEHIQATQHHIEAKE